MPRVSAEAVQAKLDTHEAVCAERWLVTIARIKRLEQIILATGAGTIALLLSIVLG